MAKKRKTVLPRLTVFAMNRRELTNFVQAVETLRLLVEDLRILTAAAQARKNTPRKTAAAQAGAAQVAAAVPAIAIPQATLEGTT